MDIFKNYLKQLKFPLITISVTFLVQSLCCNIYSQNISTLNNNSGIRSAESKYINKQIYLRWRIPSENNIYSFKLYREDNLNGQYNKIDSKAEVNTINDSTFIIVVDSLVNYRRIYRYYAVLNDTTGHLKSVSDTITIPAYNLSSVFLPSYIHADGLDSLGAIKLQWKLASPQDILTLKIYRSENYDSNYVELAEVQNTDSIFVDRYAEPMKKYFYYFEVTDPFGNSSFRSAKIFGYYKSSVQPLPPYDIIGEGTKNGNKLIWTMPSDYIMSYSIYRNDGISEDLNLLTAIKSNDSTIIFYDTSKVLKGDRVYGYTIRSESTSGILSPFSDTIYIKPNISVTLPSPLNLRGYARDSIIQLYWQNLYESMPTLDGYKVYRKNASSQANEIEEFKPVVDSLISAKQNNFTDSTIEIGKDYEYAVQAVDIYGNKSALSSYLLIQSEPIIVLPPAGIKAQKSGDGILISWDETVQQNIKEYKIYRYERGNKPILISSVTSKEKFEYLDKSVKKGNLYFYYLSTVDSENNESQSSQEVGIRF